MQIRFLLLPLLFVGCSVDTPQVRLDPVKPEKPIEKPVLDSCQVLRAEFKPEAADWTAPEVTYEILRETSRVARYSCDGSLVSNEIETVTSPRKDIALKLPGKTEYRGVFVFNETSCDHKLTTMPIIDLPLIGGFYAVTGNAVQTISLKADIAQAVFTFNIDPGLNRIFVRYYADCLPEQVPGNEHVVVANKTVCGPNPKKMTALYPIKIEYREVLLEGTRESRPSVEYCAAKK